MNEDWLDLLPIESLETLLIRLASLWHAKLDAERVDVFVLSMERTRLVVGWADVRENLCETVELPVAANLADLVPDGSGHWRRTLHPLGVPAAEIVVQGVGPDEDLVADLSSATESLLAEALRLDQLQVDALAEKLESMAEFAAGAGHEINNPLATINGRVQLLLKGETDPERRRSLTVIGGQAYRIRDMIGDAMLFGRPPEPQPRAVDAAELVRGICEKFREDRDGDEPVPALEAPDPVVVYADETQLAIVVTELLRNAVHAAGDAGTVTVQTRRNSDAPHAHGEITVVDDGPGLSDLDRRHLFDPFYSGRQAGRGLGFGLSKAWRIVRNHGGHIEVDSNIASTTVRVTWPLANAAATD